MSDWGKGVINDIGWGQGGTNDIGYGSIYADSNSGLTLLLKDNTAFIIEVKTDNTGTSNDNQFQFTGAQGDYDVVAKQNDIVVANFNDLSGQQTITLPSSGVYILEVFPKASNGFNRIQFDNNEDKNKILDTKNWGDIVWNSFENAFYGCINMTVTATDVPNLSSVTDMNSMFNRAESANPDTTNWDVSSVTNMSFMFEHATSANPDTSNWDVSSVTNMSFMFYEATSANPDVSNWDVSNATDMSFMFYEASSANPDTSNWDVSNVTDMNNMFRSASNANPDMTLWDVSSVTDMNRMLLDSNLGATNLNSWDVSNVTNMELMFKSSLNANVDCRDWDVSNVTNMRSMFEDSNLSEENLTACYENWSQLNLQQNVEFSAGSTKYNSSGQAGRDILVNTYNWLITDGSQV